MKTSIRFLFVVTLSLTAFAAHADNLSMAAYPPTSRVLKIGESIKVDFKVNYSGVKRGTSIYIIASALDGDSVILEDDNKVSAKKPKLSFCGSFTNKGINPFSIAQTNRPISTSSKYDDIIKLLEGKYPKEQLEKFKQSTKGKKLQLTFGFITTLENRSGLATGSITFKVPNLPYYYDGILLTPYFFNFNEKGNLCARYDGSKMHSIKYAVKPNRTRPKQKVREKPFVPKGTVKILSYKPQVIELVIGKPNNIKLTVRYQNLSPDSEIYVFLSPVHGDKFVSNYRTLSMKNLSFSACKSEKTPAGSFAIPAANKPIAIYMSFIGRMEAAHVVSLPKGGSGTARGIVTFSPPLLTKYYDAVKLSAVIYQWSEAGERCTRLDGAQSDSITLPLLGR